MYAIINKTNGQEFSRYFNTADALKKFIIDTYDSVDKAPDNLQVVELSDADYQSRVQARGQAANVEMEQAIKQKREKEMETAGGWSPIIAPYTTRSQVAGDADKAKSEDERKVIAMGEASKDIWSLPGRVLTSVLPWGREIIGTDASGEPKRESYGSAVGRTAEDEGTNVGGSIARSPATGVAIPLSVMAGPVVGGLGISSPFLAGGAEGAMVGAGTSAFQYGTDEDFSGLDALAETILSTLTGGAFKAGSAKFVESAKNMISKAGNFTPSQIEYLYSKLGISSGSTEQKLKAAIPERIGDIANIKYTSPELVELPAPRTYISEDIRGYIPDDVAESYEAFIKQGRIYGTLTPAQKREKEEILKEFTQAMSEPNNYQYLDRLLEEAKYFYARDPDLGQIMMNEIGKAYKINYDLMTKAPMTSDLLRVEPPADLVGNFGNVRASTSYLANQPKPVKPRPLSVTEPGSWVAQTAGRAMPTTPEKAKIASQVLRGLKMPSLVAEQDVTGNVPQYMNLREMR